MTFVTQKNIFDLKKIFFEYHVVVKNAEKRLQNGQNFTRQYLSNQYSDFTEISQTIQGPDRLGTMSPLFIMAAVY